MKRPRSPKLEVKFAGDVLADTRQRCVQDLERLTMTRADLLDQVKKLDAFIAKTKAYLRDLDIDGGDAPRDRRLSGKRSIRDMTLHVLKEAARPMQVSEIRDAIERQFGQAVPRTSISPTLSKMAQAGALLHDDDVGWSLP